MNAHCAREELLELLNETIGESDRTVEHVAHCAKCREELESLAANDWWWNESRELVVDGQSDEMIDFLSEASGVIGRSAILATSRGEPDVEPNWSVDFLESAKHPELLGRLGKYYVESVIGHGGMGIVLRGFDTELNRTVAIKVLAPHLASSTTARKRFAREARAAAAVVHDHVVAIHGIETVGELPYIVMPFISGSSLQKHVEQNGPLNTKTIVRIAMQVAAGLAAAHEQGLVHRDIKPANILLEYDVDRVLITDFGLARAADDASITRSGLVAGTPHYMSPEQANGDPIDQRSDLFSLGSVIYFMATGRAPFRGEGTMAVLNAICHKAARPLREINDDVPAPLDRLTRRLLSRAPQDRFESASTLRSTLAGYLAHLQNPLHKPLPRELSSTSRSRQVLFGVLAILVLLVGVTRMIDLTRPRGSASGDLGNTESERRPIAMSPAAGEFESTSEALAEQITSIEEDWQVNAQIDIPDDPWSTLHESISIEIGQLERTWAKDPDFETTNSIEGEE